MDTIKILRITYIVSLLTAAIITVLGETGLMPSGVLDLDPQETYIIEIVCALFTIVCIPLAMKLLNFKRVREQVKGNPQRYTAWSIIRISMLQTPLILCLLMYYLMGFDTNCAYLALMVLVAYVFIWPSRGRMEYECELSYPQNEQ